MLGVPHIEIDALHHDSGWNEAPAEVLQARVQAAFDAAPNGWVTDGNYRSKLGNLVLEQADTLVFLDPTFARTFGRSLRRTLGRTIGNLIRCTQSRGEDACVPERSASTTRPSPPASPRSQGSPPCLLARRV